MRTCEIQVWTISRATWLKLNSSPSGRFSGAGDPVRVRPTSIEEYRALYHYTDFDAFLRAFGAIGKRLRTPGDYALIRFTTSFANETAGQESVTLEAGPDKVWRVIGYVIR